MPESVASTLLTSFFLIMVRDRGASSAWTQLLSRCRGERQHLHLALFGGICSCNGAVCVHLSKIMQELDFVQTRLYKKEER